MGAIRFEWDSRKAAANLRTHGVAFEEALTVTELPYQSLINLYLRDCAASGRRLALTSQQEG